MKELFLVAIAFTLGFFCGATEAQTTYLYGPNGHIKAKPCAQATRSTSMALTVNTKVKPCSRAILPRCTTLTVSIKGKRLVIRLRCL